MPRILLADDHAIVRRHVREMLETEADFAVCAEAANGIEAVSLTVSQFPDIVILDLSMPQLNGLQAARQIHERFPLVEILILTMHDPIEVMDEAIASGVRTCILKTDLQQLVMAVRGIWQQRQSRKSSFAPDQAAGVSDNPITVHSAEHPDTLTEFERQIVKMLAQARSNGEIAAAFSLTVEAVEVHRATIMGKLKISSLFDLVHYARQSRLVETKSTVTTFLNSVGSSPQTPFRLLS